MPDHQPDVAEEKAALAAVTHPVVGSGFDEKIFKAVMRKLAGAVCVIGTSSDEGLHGLTATAVCSVSADPPTILIVVNRSSRTHPHIDAKKAFTVNLLAERQRDVAELFASKTADQFGGVAHRLLDDSSPVIDRSAAFLHCKVAQQFEVGTHTIFIGEVIDGSVDEHRPLIYHDTKFWKLTPAPDAT